MLEKNFERRVVAWFEDQDGCCLKIKFESERGFPDRIGLLPDGFICFIELKRTDGKGRVSPHQTEWIKALNHMGQTAFITDSYEEFLGLMGQRDG